MYRLPLFYAVLALLSTASTTLAAEEDTGDVSPAAYTLASWTDGANLAYRSSLYHYGKQAINRYALSILAYKQNHRTHSIYAPYVDQDLQNR